MRRSELAMEMSEISSAFHGLKLRDNFTAPAGTSNEVSANMHELHVSMAELLVASSLASAATKRYNTAKERIDRLVGDVVIEDGTQKTIHEDGTFVFSKKRLKATNETKIKDLLIELQKLGVDGDVIQNALDAAAKPRPGNMYYFVELAGE